MEEKDDGKIHVKRKIITGPPKVNVAHAQKQSKLGSRPTEESERRSVDEPTNKSIKP